MDKTKKTCGFVWLAGDTREIKREDGAFFVPRFLFFLPLGSLGFHLIYLLSISWSFYLFISCIIISGWVYCFLLHFLGWRSEMNSRAPLPLPCFISSPLLLAHPPRNYPLHIYSYVSSLSLLSLAPPHIIGPALFLPGA